MSPNAFALLVMPLIFVVVLVMECSRLHCARRVQRRLHGPVRGDGAPRHPGLASKQGCGPLSAESTHT